MPPNYKLVFELHYPDGRTEYEVPTVGNAATGMRFAGLLDQVATENYAPLRETMLKIVAYSVWQRHPDASTIAFSDANSRPCAESYTRTTGINIHCYWCRP